MGEGRSVPVNIASSPPSRKCWVLRPIRRMLCPLGGDFQGGLGVRRSAKGTVTPLIDPVERDTPARAVHGGGFP